ncbi:hypothetical protein GQX74_005054 [Glossina fuscipes]|nr:hypothetical protein GQX74_005054 [Glossina fuscipes]
MYIIVPGKLSTVHSLEGFCSGATTTSQRDLFFFFLMFNGFVPFYYSEHIALNMRIRKTFKIRKQSKYVDEDIFLQTFFICSRDYLLKVLKSIKI